MTCPAPPSRLAAAFDNLAAFTRCDRCNSPLSTPIQTTNGCDHLFCGDCDATTLDACPVCGVPTLPRKHMVHLSQLGAVLSLAQSLKSGFEKLGMISPTAVPVGESTVNGSVEDTATTINIAVAPDGVPVAVPNALIDAIPLSNVVPVADADSVAVLENTKTPAEPKTPAIRRRVKRRLSNLTQTNGEAKIISPDRSSPSKDDSLPDLIVLAGNKRPKAKEVEERAMKNVEDCGAGRRKGYSNDSVVNANFFLSGEGENATEEVKRPQDDNNNNENGKSSVAPDCSPSPATRQRLISIRKKQLIVRQKKKEVNENGETPLHVAARRGQMEKVARLIAEGAAPNTKDFAGLTPLFDACVRGYDAVVEKLLVAGAHPNTPCGEANETPLHEAVFHGHLRCVELLLEGGADLLLENIRGQTAPSLARHEEIKALFKSHLKGEAGKRSIAAAEKDRPIYIGSQVLRLNSPVLGRKPSVAVPLANAAEVTESRLVLVATGFRDDDDFRLLDEFCSAFDAKTVDEFDSSVTHVICGENSDSRPSCTVKYLQGILSGKKVVVFQWLSASLAAKLPQPEELFLASGSARDPRSDGSKRALINHFYHFPPLFSGCHFFLNGDFSDPPARVLSDLVELAGGMLLSRRPSCFDGPLTVPFHAQKLKFLKNTCYFVVSDDGDADASAPPRVFRGKSRVAYCGRNWLLDCFDRYEIIDAGDFAADNDDVAGAAGDGGDSIEMLEIRQATRSTRSAARDGGVDYLMAL